MAGQVLAACSDFDNTEGDNEIFSDDSMDEDEGADIDFAQVLRNVNEDEPVMRDCISNA